MIKQAIYLLLACAVTQLQAKQVETLIVNGTVYDGSMSKPRQMDVAIQGNMIVDVGESLQSKYRANKIVNASGKIVAPGFIDPHTHSLSDLKSSKRSANLNYLMQGVTTVFNGNDGGGPVKIKALENALMKKGIGTNTALFVGHGTVRRQVMGLAKRSPTPSELDQMKGLVKSAMEAGAFGLSSGLYYVPGNYAAKDEVVALAKVAAEYNGLYESHVRSESDIGAIAEAIDIGRQAGLPTHLAHLKALGKDSWGMSKDIVRLVEEAHKSGLKVTADQYPWLASGTRVSNAVFPKWAMADSKVKFYQRLQSPQSKDKIFAEVTEKLRWRGGPESLLIVANTKPEWIGKTLHQVATELGQDPVTTAFTIVLSGDARVASFNMSLKDVNYFMKQPWVMTSSDGTNGHPRKYASFPQKYQRFVTQHKTLSLLEFIHRSSGLTADTFKVTKRGYLKAGYYADVIILDLANYLPQANFQQPAKLGKGVTDLWVNGEHAIAKGRYLAVKAGYLLTKLN